MSGTELGKLLRKYPNAPWSWYWLSGNPNITMKDAEACPDFRNYLSRNPHITMKDVDENPSRLWIYGQNITVRDVEFHPDNPWNWRELGGNLNVWAHPDRPWNWEWLSLNPGITMKDVLAYPDKSWNWPSAVDLNYVQTGPEEEFEPHTYKAS